MSRTDPHLNDIIVEFDTRMEVPRYAVVYEILCRSFYVLQGEHRTVSPGRSRGHAGIQKTYTAGAKALLHWARRILLNEEGGRLERKLPRVRTRTSAPIHGNLHVERRSVTENINVHTRTAQREDSAEERN